MGVRMTGISGGFDPKLVESLIKAEGIPVEQAKQRREKVVEEKKEFDKLQSMLSDLDGALNGIKTYSDFYKMKVESSHPDIIDGIVNAVALPGSYEFEVRGLARSDKDLAYGFPDKDVTQVGFGWMLISREDQEPLEVTVDPGATLQDVANKINDADAGVRALVVNTGYKPDPFRLLVVSTKSGNEAKVEIDPDTTFLEFKDQVTGRNLDILFEDVPITSDKNSLEDLIDGVVFNIKRSEPGTRVQVNITPDIDKTLEGIKAFVEKYNALSDFVKTQVTVDQASGKAGVLAGDSSLRSVMRQLQSSLGQIPGQSGGKYRTLADLGITTNPKSGALAMDETKVRQALAEDYDAVANIFIRTTSANGVAERLSATLKALRDPGGGVVRARARGLETVIKNQDQDITRREERLKGREEQIRRRFTALDSRLAELSGQQSFVAQRLGGAGGGAPSGGGQ